MIRSEVTANGDHERRVRQIVDRARHEVVVRDVLTFLVARIWIILLSLGAVLSVWYAKKRYATTRATRPESGGGASLGNTQKG